MKNPQFQQPPLPGEAAVFVSHIIVASLDPASLNILLLSLRPTHHESTLHSLTQAYSLSNWPWCSLTPLLSLRRKVAYLSYWAHFVPSRGPEAVSKFTELLFRCLSRYRAGRCVYYPLKYACWIDCNYNLQNSWFLFEKDSYSVDFWLLDPFWRAPTYARSLGRLGPDRLAWDCCLQLWARSHMFSGTRWSWCCWTWTIFANPWSFRPCVAQQGHYG